MKKAYLIRQIAVCTLGIMLVPALPALAADTAAVHPGIHAEQGAPFNWILHTEHTLDELKSKLNLAPGQLPAWNTWSSGVLKDAHLQLEERSAKIEHRREEARAPADLTTPERMARGIEDLRAQTAWLQEHLVQLEAAQARTKAFYDVLDTNQKTIFDLFWHEMHHRTAGHDDSPFGAHDGFGGMRGDRDDLQGGY